MVCCGVDLWDTNYFYYEPSYEDTGVPIPKNVQTGPFHRTMTPLKQSSPSIVNVLDAIQQVVCEPEGIKLFVADPGSALIAKFPLFEWGSLGRGSKS